jgi:hypothetical protein
MADVQTYEVAEKFAPGNTEAWMVTFGNHGIHTVLVQELNQYLCNIRSKPK